MPEDAEGGGPNFTEKVTALWPPRRHRTKVPSFERTTVKAHVLAHVARSRRQPGSGPAARPDPALPWNRRERLELPLPPSGELPRGSQTTPRLDGHEVPAAAASAQAEASAPGAAPAAARSSLRVPSPPRASEAPAAPAAHGAADPAMPPLYAGISPYRHSLPATLFELTAVSPAAPAARAAAQGPAPTAIPSPAPARAVSRPGRARRRAVRDRAVRDRAARAGRARSSLHERPLPLLVLLLAVLLWSVAYWQAWTALSMNERCRAAWEVLSGALDISRSDDPGHGPTI